jgi:D-alanine-D-alanine ligase
MGKKLRIAILYNEPLGSGADERQFISETGKLQVEPAPTGSTSRRRKTPLAAPQAPVDLSEVGVLQEMEDIRSALSTLGYAPTIFNVNGEAFRLIDYLRSERPDLIFNLVESVENDAVQEMNVAGLYDLLKIPYTGAGPLGLGTALQKSRVKEILASHGIRTPRHQEFQPSMRVVLSEGLQFPLIVKPAHEDGSAGVHNASVVSSMSELRKRVRFIFEEFEQPALVEQYIEGRELNVAVLGWRPPVVLPISEIDFSGMGEGMHHIVSYEAKWLQGTVAYDGTRGVCPAQVTPAQEAEMKETALRCFQLVGCRDYARVDFRMRADGEIYVLEVNPNPDISDDAGFARSARAYGLTFSETVGKIVESALERTRGIR